MNIEHEYKVGCVQEMLYMVYNDCSRRISGVPTIIYTFVFDSGVVILHKCEKDDLMRIGILSTVLLVLLLFPYCSSPEIEKQQSHWRVLEIGRGGGTTGMYVGFRYEESGYLLHWRRFPGGVQYDTIGRLSPEAIIAIFQKADSLFMTTPTFDYVGNYQHFVVYYRPKDTVLFRWQNLEQLPAEYKDFVLWLANVQEHLQRQIDTTKKEAIPGAIQIEIR